MGDASVSSAKYVMLLAPAALLAGCATEVYQPGKTSSQVQADIAACRDEARKDSIDPITERIFIDQCLKRKGYKFRDQAPI